MSTYGSQARNWDMWHLNSQVSEPLISPVHSGSQLALGAEVPGFLGHAEAGLGTGNDHAQADETADQGREFRADQPGEGHVGDGEGDGGEEAELPGLEAVNPGTLGTEETGDEAEHEHGKDEDHAHVHQGGPTGR